MKTEDMLKWALIAGGAWFLLRSGALNDILGAVGMGPQPGMAPGAGNQIPPGNAYQDQPPAGAGGQQTQPGNGQPPSGSSSRGPAAQDPQPGSETVVNRMLAAMQGQSLNWDQYNWHYRQAGGTGQVQGPEAAGIQRPAPGEGDLPPMPFEDWVAANSHLPGLSNLHHTGTRNRATANLGRMLLTRGPVM